MLADAVLVQYDHKDEKGTPETEGKTSGKMNFSEFMKAMHGLKRKKNE